MTNSPSAARARAFFRINGEVLGAFVFSRLLLWLVAWLANHSFREGKHGQLPEGDALWTLLFRWDSHWYNAIAESGYNYVPGQQTSVAFFPAFPLCLRAFMAVTGADAPMAGFLLSNVFFLGGSLVLCRLVALDFPPPSRVPARTAWLLMLCPVTFFFSTGYSEALFLLLSLVAIYAARKRQWPVAALAGAILTATRANGIVILVPLFWEAVAEPWRSGTFEWKTVLRSCTWLLLAPLGLVAYCVYLYSAFGDPLAFVHATSAWGRTLTLPWRAALNATYYPGAYAPMFLGTEVLVLFVLALGFRFRLRMSYQLYAAAMLLLLLSNTLLESLPRYVSVIFPLPLALAAATARSEALYLMVLAASAALLTLCLALYTGGYWFT
jgi:Gpi18-like mannosyltransferase